MKKHYFVLLSLFLLMGQLVQSQISFEQSYQYSGLFAELEVDGPTFYVMDWETEQCRLYHSDYSLWKTIHFDLPNNNYLYDIKLVTQHLFNNDDLVEMLIIYRKYVPTSESYYYIYTSEVVNENGNVLLSVPGSSWVEVFSSDGDPTKMMLYVYDYSTWPYEVETRIYALPGTLSGTNQPERISQAEQNLFPNPASSAVRLAFKDPLSDQAQLIIRDVKGHIVLEKSMSQQTIQEQIDILHLSAGTYSYQVISSNLVIKPATFVVMR